LKSNENKKCKDTKRLIKIAVDCGMINKDIASKAGLSDKSIALVSSWRNGGALATERQMRYFVKEFGEQLRRKSEHLLSIVQNDEKHFIKITGDLILKHVIRKHVESQKKVLKIALARLLIFRQSDKYYLVSQVRKGFDSQRSFNKDMHNQMAHCDSEDANWESKGIPKLLSLEELLKCTDDIAAELKDGRFIPRETFIYSGQELQFSLRRYFLKEGIHVPDVIDISNQN
jgi:hypothetical protein